jgi:alkaline phosphatase
MTPDKDPLLHRQDTDSLDQAEEDALLTGQPTHRKPSRRYGSCREISLFVWAVVATGAVIILGVAYQQGLNKAGSHLNEKPHGKRNLIFMVSDGMGPTSLSLTRSYKQFTEGLPYGNQLVLDKHMIGQSRTRSSSSLVTDSAAGATAFSCGMKSYNGAISVLDDHSPCGTVLEAAKLAGYMTGLVVTTRITDATPATFAAHVNMRSEEDLIAEQMVGQHPLGRVVDMMLGGGKCHFLPNTTHGSCRADDKDIVKLARSKGYSYASNRKEFDALKLGNAVDLPILGLFADTDIPYEIDRRNENHIYPSLDEMATTALKALSEATKDSKHGFFLMIEGSRIDHAGHANDPAAQVHEVLAYDKTMAVVLDFLQKDSTPGVMVSTSDHETGGLATARQLHPTYPEYFWYPGVLANVSHSAERLAVEYFHKITAAPKDDMTDYIRNVVTGSLGIHDASEEEIRLLVDHPETSPYTFADMVSRRSQSGWSTHGHSGKNFLPNHLVSQMRQTD